MFIDTTRIKFSIQKLNSKYTMCSILKNEVMLTSHPRDVQLSFWSQIQKIKKRLYRLRVFSSFNDKKGREYLLEHPVQETGIETKFLWS